MPTFFMKLNWQQDPTLPYSCGGDSILDLNVGRLPMPWKMDVNHVVISWRGMWSSALSDVSWQIWFSSVAGCQDQMDKNLCKVCFVRLNKYINNGITMKMLNNLSLPSWAKMNEDNANCVNKKTNNNKILLQECSVASSIMKSNY